LPKYLKLGVQGFRFDVVDELKSDFVDRIRETVNKYNDKAVLIGEVWEDASNKIAYGERKKYFENGQLNSVMNYPLKDAIIKYCLDEDENALVYVMRMLKDHYPKQVQSHMMNIIGTHDTMRILSVLSLGCDRRDSSYKKKDTVVPAKLRVEGLRRLKIASLLQFTTVGVPCIYYGDEAGLTGDNDPFNRKCFPWDNINKSIYEWYKDLGRLRQNPAFCGGDLNVLYNGEGVVVYDRVLDNDRVLVLINNSKNPFPARIDNEMKNFETGELFQGDLVMDPYTFLIFEKV
jgi:glycosidase